MRLKASVLLYLTAWRRLLLECLSVYTLCLCPEPFSRLLGFRSFTSRKDYLESSWIGEACVFSGVPKEASGSRGWRPCDSHSICSAFSNLVVKLHIFLSLPASLHVWNAEKLCCSINRRCGNIWGYTCLDYKLWLTANKGSNSVLFKLFTISNWLGRISIHLPVTNVFYHLLYTLAVWTMVLCCWMPSHYSTLKFWLSHTVVFLCHSHLCLIQCKELPFLFFLCLVVLKIPTFCHLAESICTSFCPCLMLYLYSYVFIGAF